MAITISFCKITLMKKSMSIETNLTELKKNDEMLFSRSFTGINLRHISHENDISNNTSEKQKSTNCVICC